MSEKGILKKIDDIFDYCEEIDNHLPKEEQTGYRMLPDIFYIQKEVRNLQQKVKQLEKENEYLKMSNPEQNMEHFRIVNENKRKIDMLRKENHQLENIRKEAIGYIKSVYIPELQEGHICINYKETDYLLNILNKGGISKYE